MYNDFSLYYAYTWYLLGVHARRGEREREREFTVWSRAIQMLAGSEMKFALNAANDTLPHNANLSRWRGLSADCKLCGGKQTLNHILNHCKKALELHRFNTRHDAVLEVIADFVSKQVSGDS